MNLMQYEPLSALVHYPEVVRVPGLPCITCGMVIIVGNLP